jgi:hypothetical protein
MPFSNILPGSEGSWQDVRFCFYYIKFMNLGVTMKKISKIASVLAVLATSAFTASNVENPLYAPAQMEFFSKTGFGFMYKKTDHTDANIKAGNAGKIKFPIIRIYEDMGFGILDNLSINFALGYTHDRDAYPDDARSGMHLGRIGLDFRVLDGASTEGFVWDIYSHWHLGGIGEMAGDYSLVKGFKYDNYSNGRWGVYGGTRVGYKMEDKFAVAAFFEVLQTFGNDNNKINLKPAKQEAPGLAAQANAGIAAAGIPGGASTITACTANTSASPACPTVLGALSANQKLKEAYEGYMMASAFPVMPDNAAVNLKSTTEINAGLKGIYQINDTWSVGGHFTFKNHADNGVESVSTKPSGPNAIVIATQEAVMKGMADKMENMQDGFNEYVIGLSGALQITDNVQTVIYIERTMDTAHSGSQNGTHAKGEMGLRANVHF